MRAILNKTVNSDTAIRVDERVISYDLLNANASLRTWVAYYNAAGEVIGEENHALSDIIDSDDIDALIAELEGEVGSCDYAILIISTNKIAKIDYETTGNVRGVFTLNQNLVSNYSTVLSNLATAANYTPIDKTITTVTVDSRYNAFGNVFDQNGTNILMTFRSGTTHLINGRIDLLFNAANVWADRETFQTPGADVDYRDPRGGQLGGEKLIVFTTRYKPSDDTVYDLGYFLSDDLDTNEFDAYVALTPPDGVDRAITYGPMIESDTAGTYYAACYGSDATFTNFWMWVWKIEYASGIPTFSRIDVYAGTTKITETSIVKIGGGRFILISRCEGTNKLYQFTSSDGGETWSAPAETNLGVSGQIDTCVPSMPLIIHGIIHMIYQDRYTGYLVLAKGYPDTVFIDPEAWVLQNYVANANLGYPSMCFVPGYNDRVLLIWCLETSSSVAVIYSRYEDFSDY